MECRTWQTDWAKVLAMYQEELHCCNYQLILLMSCNSNLKPTIAQEICALKDVRSQSHLAQMIKARNLRNIIADINKVIAYINKAGNKRDNFLRDRLLLPRYFCAYNPKDTKILQQIYSYFKNCYE